MVFTRFENVVAMAAVKDLYLHSDFKIPHTPESEKYLTCLQSKFLWGDGHGE